ncbi:MAG: DNRLRE domain-containing protein [Candidatus Cloacimonetes bacterium]|nr:DNRLRE domain-containing protein [Candidatus Cloacimonadota bacterium]
MKNSFLSLLLICFAAFSYAELVSLSPTDDMYTDAENPGTSAVTTELWTANFSASQHFERIMLNFDLSEYTGQSAQTATLHLTRFYSCPSGGTTATTFYAISEAWDENTWDYTQHIQYDPAVNMPYVFSGTGGGAIVQFAVDVTGFINQFLDGSFENHGFAILANSNQKFSKFFSKEYANADYRPRLDISFEETGVDDNTAGIAECYLTNYPNPFNPSTTISLSIQNAIYGKPLKLIIYNHKGQKVKDLSASLVHTTPLEPGRIRNYTVAWNGKDERNQPVPSGVYFYKLSSGHQYISSNKMVLLK